MHFTIKNGKEGNYTVLTPRYTLYLNSLRSGSWALACLDLSNGLNSLSHRVVVSFEIQHLSLLGSLPPHLTSVITLRQKNAPVLGGFPG